MCNLIFLVWNLEGREQTCLGPQLKIYFLEYLGAFSEEKGERFRQDIKEIESRYQANWNIIMIADYCWMLKRDNSWLVHKKKSGKISIEKKRFVRICIIFMYLFII